MLGSPSSLGFTAINSHMEPIQATPRTNSPPWAHCARAPRAAVPDKPAQLERPASGGADLAVRRDAVFFGLYTLNPPQRQGAIRNETLAVDPRWT